MRYLDDLIQPSKAALLVFHGDPAHASLKECFAAWDRVGLPLSAPHTQPERPPRHEGVVYTKHADPSSGIRQDVDGVYSINGVPVQHPRRHEVSGFYNPYPGEPHIAISVYDRETDELLRHKL